MPFIGKIKTSFGLVLILLFFFQLLFYFNSFNSPFERDEGEYAYSAWLMKEGVAPYENSFLLKPPMIIYTYLLGLFIDSEALWPPRVLAFIFSFFTAVLIGLIAKKEFGERTGIAAMFLFVPMNALPNLASLAANTERFMQLPLVGVLAIYVYFKRSSGFRPWFWTGFLSMAAFCYKQIAFVPLSFIIITWVMSKIGARSIFPRIKDFFLEKVFLLPKKVRRAGHGSNFDFGKARRDALLVAVFLFSGIMLGVVLNFGYFLIFGKMKFVWESIFEYSGLYARENFLKLDNFWRYMGIFLTHWWAIMIFIVLYILSRGPRSGFYLSLVFLSLATVMSSISHYYLLLMPFLAVIGAASIIYISEIFYESQKGSRPGETIFISLVFLGVILSMIIPVREQFGKNPEEMNLWIYGNAVNPFIEARTVAEKVKELTSPDDKVFISGSEPEILFYSKRRSPSRFIIAFPLIINTSKLLIYQKEVISSLENNLPEVIVTARFDQKDLEKIPLFYFENIDKILREKYWPVGGFVRTAKGEGYWQEPLQEENFPLATLTVYGKI